MMISIAICTYNNAKKLAVTLESLRGLICPRVLQYEILVVDNNSCDETKEVVGRFQGVLGQRLRYVFEGIQGLSHARNRALKEAMGDIVSYIDDDVKVEPGWLSAVAAAFEEYPAAVVGGKSYLIYPSKRPSWLPEQYEILLSKLDYGDQVLVGTDKDLFGLNFSVRKDMALRAGGFDPSLGRCGAVSLRCGEESDLLRRIRDFGGVAVYEPRAVVGHIVSQERLAMRWFVRRAFAPGMHGEGPRVSPSAVHLLRCCGSVFRSLVRGEIKSDVLFGKTLAVVAALRPLYESIRRLWLPGSER
jgi:glycosyltransferase involved in cell wall biosynthesis